MVTLRCRISISMLLAMVAGETAIAARTLAEVQADGKLVVLFSEQQTAFFRSTGKGHEGFDVELLAMFAERHGLRLAARPLPLDRLVAALDAGEGEVIAGAFTRTPERAAKVAFTDEVTPQRHVVVTLPPHPPVDRPADLVRWRVGTVPGSSWREAALAAGVPEKNLVDIPFGASDCIAALRGDRIDAAVTGLFFALMMRETAPNLHLGAFVGPVGYHAYAVRPADVQLLAALNAFLKRLRGTHLWFEKVRRHFGESAPALFRQARAKN